MQSRRKKVGDHPQGQFALLKTKRFAPFFWTQVFGAFNDNLFKTALAVALAFRAASGGGDRALMLLNVAAGLFIAPFLIFSGLAGQVADKYEKAMLIRRIKAAEVLIMAAGGLALILGHTGLQLAMLFAMGTQSAFFGPVKYSLLPQHLQPSELVGGNGMVEMGTFVAILGGTIAGSLLIAVPGGAGWTALAVLSAALAGWAASRGIPCAVAADPSVRLGFNPLMDGWRAVRLARQDRSVFRAVLGLSWFWLVGSAYVTQLPAYVRDVLHAGPSVVTLLLAAFTLGVAGGSLLCERLSHKQVETGLVPVGSLLMGLAGLHLTRAFGAPAPEAARTLAEFLTTAGSPQVLMDLVLIGLGGGLYTVPLFAWIQSRTSERIRSRMIAANNIINALAMVLAAGLAVVCMTWMDVSLNAFFGGLAAVSLLIGIGLAGRAPLSLARIALRCLTHLFYRVRCEGLDNIPRSGPAVLVCNHVSYVDALIIAGAAPRPVRFVMHIDYFNLPLLRCLFRMTGMIPIDSGKRNPAVLRHALERIDNALRAGDLVCIFPEGRLTRDGRIGGFRPGIESIVQRSPVPVIPLALRGLWGSFFSHKGGAALRHRPRGFRSRIDVAAGGMMQPATVTARRLQVLVRRLRGARA